VAVHRVEFEWDESKRESNICKHEIDFRDAVAVFDDARCVFEDVTRPEYGEIRNKAIGRMGARVICVIFTDRGDVRRIISARRSRRNEREQYRKSAESS
jgi:uncharacterized protein